jgi:hypothetical protein
MPDVKSSCELDRKQRYPFGQSYARGYGVLPCVSTYALPERLSIASRCGDWLEEAVSGILPPLRGRHELEQTGVTYHGGAQGPSPPQRVRAGHTPARRRWSSHGSAAEMPWSAPAPLGSARRSAAVGESASSPQAKRRCTRDAHAPTWSKSRLCARWRARWASARGSMRCSKTPTRGCAHMGGDGTRASAGLCSPPGLPRPGGLTGGLLQKPTPGEGAAGPTAAASG